MDWGYLDELDCNLLYTYAKGFAKCSGRFCMEKSTSAMKRKSLSKNS